MSGSVVNSLKQYIVRIAPERRIYVRSEAHTSCFRLSPFTQVSLGICLVLLAGWTLFASSVLMLRGGNMLMGDDGVVFAAEAFEQRIARLSADRAELREALEARVDHGEDIRSVLGQKQRVLIETADMLAETRAELSALRAQFNELQAARHEDRERVARFDQILADQRAATAAAERNAASMGQTMDRLASTMGAVVVERDAASGSVIELQDEVALLEAEVSGWEGRQQRLLGQLEEAARISLSSLDKVFRGTEVDLESILSQTERDYTGQGGGPFQPIAGLEHENAGTDDLRIAALMNDLERINLMRVAIDRLPFGKPTLGARLTSNFGPRRDPKRNRYAMHNGIDLAAPRGTPIYSTADGIVVFSGRQRGYGIIVKIRHAFGFETVYAHLNRARVKVGERVERGQRIADMGSTGRSTGSHLHYEIRIDKKPVNPSKFIRAARNVL